VVWIWGPAFLQMIVIFAFSSIPNLTATPLDVTDHTGHFIGYALLGALVVRAVARGRWQGVTPRAALAAWVLSAAYGITDEWHQEFVPGRSPAVDDWIADALGAAAAVLLVLAAARLRQPGSREV
jgi:VanZ family protein